MEPELEKINGGAFQIARKLFDSVLWLEKPASWNVVWIYILGNVNHKKRGSFERGEGFFNWERLVREERLGEEMTIDMVKSFLMYSRTNAMITTKRTTRGMRLKVLNYNKYQTFNNYIDTNETTSEPRVNHDGTPPIHKNVKNVKNEKNVYNASRAKTSFPEENYVRVLTEYQRLKGISLKGMEFLPIKKHIKLIFESERSPEDIIRFMKWFAEAADSGERAVKWTEQWNMNTVRNKLPEFLAGKLDY